MRRTVTLPLVVLLGILGTAAATLYVADVADRQQEERFSLRANEAIDAVRGRMDAYVATLRATRGLFVDGYEPPRHAFREFVEAIGVRHHYPGIQGIGYAKWLRPEDVARHEAAVRTEGNQTYRVWPEGERDEYSAIVYLEPFDARNQRAFGFDMFHEPVRREAMERARDTGEPAASGRVELVQEEADEERQWGFLIYLPIQFAPVYGEGEHAVPARREQLVGWVYAPFRVSDLLRATLGLERARSLDFEVFDGPEPDDAARIFDGDPSRHGGGRERIARLDVAGRTWTARLTAGPGLSQLWEVWLPRAVPLAGLALTALLYLAARAEARSLALAEAAKGRAEFLADAGRALGATLDYGRALQHVVDLAAERVADGAAVHVEEPDRDPLWIAGRGPGAARALAALRERDPGPSASPDVLTVPLFARGEVLGALALVAGPGGRRFTAEDVAMAEDLGRVAVAAIDTGRLYRRAHEAVRLRDEFLSIASHELKTPLTSLGLQAESLRAQAARAPTETVVRKAEAIHRNVERLGRLVATMLDLSRITAGRLELDLEPVDLSELAAEVVARFDEEARRAGSELRLAAEGHVRGRWDRLRLDQVLTNLLANALKYGQGNPVDVEVEARGDAAVVRVRDRGIGIAPADQARIFGRFERAVSERNYGGFGLGLWIVRSIVEALGGRVSVESVPGAGSTFVVELRRDAEEARRGPWEDGAAPRPAP